MKNERPRINLFNRQRRCTVGLSDLRVFLNRLTERLDLEAGFSVVLLSDRAMQKFNKRFAGKQGPTDVLSFPAGSPEESYLGDILVSVESADRQRKSSLEIELCILILHGVLHLMGYDHETDEGEMSALETSLREAFGLE